MATEGVRVSVHSWVTRGSAGCLGQSHLRELLPSSRLATTDTLGRLLGTGLAKDQTTKDLGAGSCQKTRPKKDLGYGRREGTRKGQP